MAYLNLAGFETGDALEARTTAGTFSIQTTVKRTGSYALRINPATTSTGWLRFGTFTATGSGTTFTAATAYYRVYVRYATKPGSGAEEICVAADSGLVDKLSVRLNSSGQLEVYDATATLVATGASALSQDTWYRVEIKVPTGASASYEVRLDGTTYLSGTCNCGTNNNAHFYLGKVVNRSGQSIDVYYDDLAIKDDDWCGAGEVKAMTGDGDSATHTGFTANTGAKWDAVDEIPHDSDSTYISSSTNGATYASTLVSSATAGISGTINAVKVFNVVRDEGGSSALRVLIRSGGTDSVNGSNRDPGSSYAISGRILTTDPTDSNAWSTSKLDALEIGIQNNAAVAVRCTAMWAMVDYTPSSINTDQNAFRLRNDDGDEVNATWVANLNTNASLNVDTNYRIRIQVNNAGADRTVTRRFEYSHNSGAWTNISTSSSVVRAVSSTHVTDGEATTERLAGSGTFFAGEVSEDNTLAGLPSWPTGRDIEDELVFQIRSADVANGDSVRIRVTDGGTPFDSYSQIPNITVVEAAAGVTSRLMLMGVG